MAGFATGFDGGGAIPDDDQYTDDGASPAIPDNGAQPAGASPPAAQEGPETFGDAQGRPWYKQTNGMLPINMAEAAGRKIRGAFGGDYQHKEGTPLPDVGSKYQQLQEGLQSVGDEAKKEFGEGVENIKRGPYGLHEKVGQFLNSGTGDPNEANPQSGAKRIISYLMGSDAADPQAIDKINQGVALEHPELSDDDRNLAAVQKAYDHGGDAAGWSVLQFNRMAYNAKQSFANAALTGTDGKPADPQAAAQAATEASKHVLDGSHTKFVAGPDGNVTATVKLAGTQTPVNFNLTPEQFKAVLNFTSVPAQWEHLMESGGIIGQLQKVTNIGQTTGQTTGETGQTTGETGQTTGQTTGQQQDQPTAYGTGDGQVAPLQYLSKQDQARARGMSDGSPQGEQRKTGPKFDDDLMRRANVMFPRISQGDQRNRWLVQTQEQRDNSENEGQVKKDVETIKTGGRVEVQNSKNKGGLDIQNSKNDATKYSADQRYKAAVAHYDAQTQMALQRSNQRAAQMAQNANDAAMREIGRNVRKRQDDLVLSGEQVTPEVVQKIWEEETQRVNGLSGRQPYGAPQAPTPQAQTPQAQAPQAQAPGGGQVQSPEDQRAIQWAQAHPGTPQAKLILEHHGQSTQ